MLAKSVYKIKGLARELGLHYNTVYLAIHLGRLEAVRSDGAGARRRGNWLISRAAARKWLSARDKGRA